MTIEKQSQPEIIAEPNEQPAIKAVAGQSIIEKEIAPEIRARAEQAVLDTLEADGGVFDFNKKLADSTASLPKYQQIKERLQGVDKQELPYELFKALQKKADEAQVESAGPKDGVLIKSMRQGSLECAGRTLIASTFLQEQCVDHAVVSAPGHSFLIVEQSQDTLVYFDANNNLFFTFPREALTGYKGSEISAECQLNDYVPGDKDFVDGINTVSPRFISMPPQEGVGRQYLGNIEAALNGDEEFRTSGIEKDEEVAKALEQMQTEIYGENDVYNNFYTLFKDQATAQRDDRELVTSRGIGTGTIGSS